MKPLKTITQYFAIVLILIMATEFSASAQNAIASETKTELVKPVQAGTVELVQGKVTVQLNERLRNRLSADRSTTYFVVLTPIGSCGQLSLSEKGEQKFVISENTTSSLASFGGHSCDYVVFIKETMPSLTNAAK